jgi:hypothetical protein
MEWIVGYLVVSFWSVVLAYLNAEEFNDEVRG